jgi:ABC-type transporter Mla subunit MlaD
MTLARVKAVLELALIAAAITMLISATLAVNHIATKLDQTLTNVQMNSNNVRQMLNATLYQIGDLAKETHDTIQMEQKYLKVESQTLIATNQKLNETLEIAQTAIKTNSADLSAALKPIPSVLDQTQATLVASATTITGLQETEKQLNTILLSLQPTATHLDVTMDHVASITTQADAEMKKFVAPTPWYKKLENDLILAGKVVADFY